MKSILLKHRFLILFVILFLLLRLPSFFEPYWYGDEGIYLTLGQGIRNGLTLYSQIHDNKPPTLYYLAATAQTVFGFRLILLFWMAATVCSFYLLSKKIISPVKTTIATLIFLILTSIPLLEGNIANAEIFMLFPTILAVDYLLSAKKTKDFILPGLLLGFAFTIKIPVFAEMAGFVLFLGLIQINIFKKPKICFLNLFVFCFSFLLPIIFWGLYFFTKNIFPEFLKAALLQNFGYLSSWSSGSHTGGGLLSRGLIWFLFLAFIYFLNFKKYLNSKVAFLLFWFSSAVFGALLSSRPYPHYLIQILPPLCLLLFFSFKKLYWLLLLVFLGFVVIKYKFYFYPVFGYYSNFYSYTIGLKSKTSYQKFFGQNLDLTYQIADYVKKNSDPQDRLFVWGDEPYLYPLTKLLPASKYTVAYHIVDFKAYQSVIDELKTHPPKFIVYYAMNQRPYSELDNFLRFYSLVNRFGSVQIYRFNE
ncbi:MAG: hypothetical protein WC596_04545 [Candidatus Shapirobacteria bacterium]